jgi:MoaA/NifB/PqqE/SkfB family radical SAM enzyme
VFYSKPAAVLIELTNACNLNCETCYRGDREQGFMDFNLFKRAVDQVAEIGNVNVYLHFSGEPLLHPDFIKMLEYVSTKRSKLYNVGFFTNGMLLDESKAEALVRCKVDWVTISIDGVGKVQERIRRGSVYSKVEENVNRLLLIRNNSEKPLVFINTTISSQSDQELDEIKKVWKSKVNGVIFSPCVDSETFRLQNVERWKQYSEVHKRDKICKLPLYELIVHWNGTVGFCCHDFNGYGVVGNMKNSSIMEIWKSEGMKSARQFVVSGKRRLETPPLCIKCLKVKS